MSMLSTGGGGGDDGAMAHWDKEEELWSMCGGLVYVHPHVSTVPYLTNLSAAAAATAMGRQQCCWQ